MSKIRALKRVISQPLGSANLIVAASVLVPDYEAGETPQQLRAKHPDLRKFSDAGISGFCAIAGELFKGGVRIENAPRQPKGSPSPIPV
ncbi:hypothetical protein [Variovorax sp. 770b2]|uniref:hypothetical protein n=1 Tax=Variovorax sp. 770b2 TaxID=1566271 RepID=UPI0008F2372A|nr:hypothetical protein [Variovorax sp. 770b2]SFQ34075.1 hypothetical protein SAMN03159339_6845 [Variovorax sp. 770b2]